MNLLLKQYIYIYQVILYFKKKLIVIHSSRETDGANSI